MEEMIARWIKETLREHEIAKKNQNAFKMIEMGRLVKALRKMREVLTISRA